MKVSLCYIRIFKLNCVIGQAGGLSQRCLCRGKLPKAVKPRWIRAVELFPPSPSCSKTEIMRLKVYIHHFYATTECIQPIIVYMFMYYIIRTKFCAIFI
uniref:Chemokine interleukin-8-like domain-containing protein n=1 Tax=Sinocyclocheilus rhinocerous TaxID=307959 RepID=A0A673KLK3_9TELE